MKLLSVQYLRAIAAFLVLIYHMFLPSHLNIQSVVKVDFEELGKMGVDLFFVLSGFIMSYIIQFEKSPALFIRKRMARIYPTYWEVYLLAILAWIILHGIFHIDFMRHGSWFSNLSLLPFELGGETKPVLSVAWTLYYEIFFYSVIAIILFLFKNPKPGVYCFLAILFLLPKNFLGLQNIVLFEFLGGFFLMEFFKKKNFSQLLAVVFCVIIIYFKRYEFGWIYVIFALLFLSGEKLSQKLPTNKLLEKIGDASYSLYLIHFPLCGLANYFAAGIKNFWVMIVYVLAWMGVIVWLAIVNFERFEKPIARKLKRFSARI